MKLFNIRNVFGLSFAVLLAACGAGNEVGAPTQTAALIETNVSTSAQPAAATQVANAAMPAPDCAADGCKGLRIIDANAEAFRYHAMQAAAPQS
jgi:hypothetical protein